MLEDATSLNGPLRMGTPNNRADIEALASILEQHSVGVGRITPGPRGSRLSGEPRRLLEAAIEALGGEEIDGATLVYANACYALGRHDEASAAYRKLLEQTPDDVDARFNLGLAHLRLREPEQAVREFTETLVRSPQLAEA